MNDTTKLTYIRATSSKREDFRELLRYRELFYFLAWRDVIVRYKQTALGISWAILRPLLNMCLFTLVFGKLVSLPSAGVSYPLFVLTGMLPWQLFSGVCVHSCQVFVTHSDLVSKIYFPRYILPITQMSVHWIDFAIGAVILLIMIICTATFNLWGLLAVIPYVLILSLLCLGVCLLVSPLTVKFHDLHFIVPFFIQAGMFLSPVVYGSFMVSDKWFYLYALNPMVGIIDGLRWAFLGVESPHLLMSTMSSFFISLFVFILGVNHFRSQEKTIADWI